jgi:hypothetical protein
MSDDNPMAEHSQNQRERLNYLEFRLYFTGQISRADLIQRFGISEAAATRDLAIYRDEAAENLEFDTVTKIYRISKSFALSYLKSIDPKQLLRALVHGIGNDFGTEPESLVPCELPSRLQAPSADVLASVSRAICQKAVLRIEYLSDSGNHGPREIVPFSFVGTGLKWLVRAYCRRKGIFCDFIVNRIKHAEVVWDAKPLPAEDKENDDEWNRMLKLELIPHPKASPEKKAMIAQEFQMSDGVHVLRVRAALAGYVLRLWSVDCSPTQRLELFPLCLRNLMALHDVDNALLAPGYERPASS